MNVMHGAVRKTARGLVRDFNEVENLQVSRKGPADFVTKADMRADERLREELGRARPAFGFLTEEGGGQEGSDPRRRWIIDPLDGTTNFLHGIPYFAISVALEEAGQIVAGVIYQPVSDELFWAERGAGAFLNDRRLRVASRHQLDDAVIGTGLPQLGRPGDANYHAQLEAMMQRAAGIRRMGAAALDLAYVAAGRFDAFWETGLAPWDVAAGLILVREAGGRISRTDGGEDVLNSGSVLASNDALHGRVLRLFREVRA